MRFFCADDRRRRSLFGRAAILLAATMSFANGVRASDPPSSSAVLQELRAFRECGSVLYVAAHPDDENTQFIAYLSKGRGVRTAYLSLTRGEGGQNLIGPEIGDPLGVIRTQELLAARRVDGGEQFFSRARDFGFSKSYEQTLAKWDRREVLSDVVRVIRRFQPDVIVTRFPPEGGGTHGHHTASTILTLEAFKIAGDPHQFPEQITRDGLTPWQPKRIFWNSFRGAGGEKPLRLNIGGYLPILGQSLGELSALSRSNHRSQGYGSVGARGSRFDDFLPLDGQPAGKDLFDGIDTTWARFPGGAVLAQQVDDLIAKFDPLRPAAILPVLLSLHKQLVVLPPSSQLRDKQTKLDRLIQDCLGLHVETTTAQAEAVPGETIHLRRTAILRTDHPVDWLGTEDRSLFPPEEPTALHDDQPVLREIDVKLPADLTLTQPYWLREEGSAGMYRVDDPNLIGQPENLPSFTLTHLFRIDGETIRVPDEVVQITADPAKGEVHRRLDIIPPVSLTLGCDVQIFTPGSTHEVEVTAAAARAELAGVLQLDVPSGWQVSPAAYPFRFKTAGEHAAFAFSVTAPTTPTTGNLIARASLSGSADASVTANFVGSEGEAELYAALKGRHPLEVRVTALRDDAKGIVTLSTPAGYKFAPVAFPFHLLKAGDKAPFRFDVTLPDRPGLDDVTILTALQDTGYDTSRQAIRYEHIPPQLLQSAARCKAVCLNLAIRGEAVGYLPGAGDHTADSLAAMGYHVTPLTGSDLTPDRLQAFDAVVVGVRAFNVRTDLAPGLPALFAYAEGGGNVVVQYNTPNDLHNPKLAPFDLELSRDLPGNRVTNENAPVTFLVPDHPVLTAPNRITSADFEGWVQERGLNFPSKWDHDHFTAVLACSDPGETPLTSGLLVADIGRGHFVYTGLSFFRQLPAGIPGAYRLFANLVSLPPTPVPPVQPID